MVSEMMIREKVLHLTLGRNSHSVAVVVDSMKRDEERQIKVHIEQPCGRARWPKGIVMEKANHNQERSEPLRMDIELMLGTRSS